MKLKSIKQSIRGLLISGIILSFFVFTACTGGQSTGDPDSFTYGGASEEVYKTDSTGPVNVSLNLGSATKDVYMIFTNTSLSSDTTSPFFMDIAGISNGVSSSSKNLLSESSAISEKTIYMRGTPAISEFNRDPWSSLGIEKNKSIAKSESMISITPPLKSYMAGTTVHTFYTSDHGDTITATCRAVVSNSGHTLVIWVADASWSNTSAADKIDPAMVTPLAAKFLKSSGTDDIYHWETSLYGSEWGTSANAYSAQLISTAKSNNEVHILLTNLNTSYSAGSTVTLGFFWTKDNCTTSIYPYSNERIMFYIDAYLYSHLITGESSWSINNYWPQELISTLGHEFQHMIHFYQGNVVRNNSPDTWIDEMCSLTTEDLLADKLSVKGPRGVLYSDTTAGSAGNTDGRPPMFNYYNHRPLTTWLPDTGGEVLESYSMAYTFGAYLARNFGGAALFRDIVQGQYGDYRDVVTAVNNHGGGGVTFNDLLRNWAVAVVLSDKTTISAPGNYSYNKPETDTYNGITYTTGALNLYNYISSDLSSNYHGAGPTYYAPSDLAGLTASEKSSNTYVHVGSFTGLNTWKLNIPAGIKTTLVVR